MFFLQPLGISGFWIVFLKDCRSSFVWACSRSFYFDHFNLGSILFCWGDLVIQSCQDLVWIIWVRTSTPLLFLVPLSLIALLIALASKSAVFATVSFLLRGSTGTLGSATQMAGFSGTAQVALAAQAAPLAACSAALLEALQGAPPDPHAQVGRRPFSPRKKRQGPDQDVTPFSTSLRLLQFPTKSLVRALLQGSPP